MSALNDLIQKIADEDLRRRIEKEIAALKGTKKFEERANNDASYKYILVEKNLF